jgi:cadmium resistance protein CadD (predicted permease)
VIASIGLAAALFVATDIDDLVMLTALFALAPHRRRQIVCGQYLGIAALVAFSAAATLGLLTLPGHWIRWIGLVPLVLGIKALVEVLRRSPDDEPDRTNVVGVISTATLTIAGGGDNLAAYIPVLQQLPIGQWPYLFGVFAIGVALWCALAARLGGHPRVQAALNRTGHWIVPVVYIAIGAWVLL